MPNLVIDDIVDVVVSTAAPATPRNGFNIGLIVGKTVGTGMSADNRCIIVASADELLDAGYTVNSPEYKAATLYFSQTPAPSKLVVGLCAKGSGDTYETWVEAITACRNANSDWYACYVADETALTTAEITAIAAYIQTKTATFFFEDSTAADITNATTDIFSALKAAQYRRVFGLYSNTKYAGAAAMGFAMGANDGTAASAYTMAYKTLTGVTPDDLTLTQVTNLQGKNANYYVVRGGAYYVLEKGIVPDGTWFDEIINLDQLAYDMQKNCMDVLANTRTKIPYTDAGALRFVLACNEACDNAVTRGVLAPGVWKQPDVMDLEQGDMLTAGYLVQAESVDDRPYSEKSLRICPPLYVCVNLAGAIHNATIKVFVQ